MVRHVGVHRADDTDIVNRFGDMGEQLADFKDYFEDTINFINSNDILQHVYDSKWDKQNRKEHHRKELEEKDRTIERLKAEVNRLKLMLESSNERGKQQIDNLKEENELLRTHVLKSNEEWQACFESVGNKHKEELIRTKSRMQQLIDSQKLFYEQRKLNMWFLMWHLLI